MDSGGLGGRISCPANLRPLPGQYLLASAPDLRDPLPVVIFPGGLTGDGLVAPPPLPPAWTVGMTLNLRGPLGRGFHLPGTARRVALAGLDGSPARLLPLAVQALAQHASVAVYAPVGAPLADLPVEVEILPLELLPEAPAWADFLALSISLASLGTLRDRLGLDPFGRLLCHAQVLVVTAMPCGGIGECGVCSTPTRKGWALACSDGPVFDFTQLEGV